MHIRIGTRGSRLAMIQTNMVIEALKEAHENLTFDVIEIKTKGDKILDRSLEKIGDKGLFVKEIEARLMDKSIDLAVHSMKDMPSEGPEALMLMPVLERADARDVLVTVRDIETIDELPKDCVIGTGSKRRSSQLRILRPDAVIKPIRGNVETRIRRMKEEGMDGTILAAAGVNRLGIDDTYGVKVIPFSVETMIPAPAQGIIGCQMKKDNQRIKELVKAIIDQETALQCETERAYLARVNGSCHLPMGAYLELGNRVRIRGIFGDAECKHIRRMTLEGSEEEVSDLAIQLAEALKEEVGQ